VTLLVIGENNHDQLS